ncbi:hypothetical protein C810_00924 [Lachnospiraceae bacterium A2]|nr:hypothetical protein C810_00924 [Lachnospiraceae bacterium A2]
MKRIMKIILGFVVFIIIVVLWGSFAYVSDYKITNVDTSVSPDETYELVLQDVGEADFPFGSASGRLVLYEGKRRISKADFELFDDGGCIRSGIWEVTWHEDYVEVIISGDEQFDEQIILYFDGKKERKQLTDKDEYTEAGNITFAEYSGYWSYEGKTHEQILAEGGIELSCTITEDNQFSGTLFSQQEMMERFALIENISGKIEQSKLYFDYADDEWGNSGTLHIQFLSDSIYVEILNYKKADNGSDYGINGSFELIREKEDIEDKENIPEENSSDHVQDKLDEERIIEEQSFQIELNDWGEVRFVPYEPTPSERVHEDVTFYLLKDDEILYQFPYISKRPTNGMGYFWDVKFVMFTDTNADGKEDVVIGAEYMTGAGPQGAVPHVAVRIYEDCGDYFTYNEELSDKINNYLPWESNVLAKDIKRLIQLTNGNEPLTNYESYSGKWTVSPGYVAAYENPMPESGNELTCSISNGNEFYGNLFIEQEMTERIASVEDIVGTIQNGELFFDFADDGWGGAGTLHIMFLPNQINVEVLNHKIAEENVIGYGVSGNYEMTIRE